MIVVSLVQLIYFLFFKDGRREVIELMPTLKDFTDVRDNMLHYFGFKKDHPKFGRYDYGEKAEYLALIWGVIVMTITGFILWFPEFFIGFLPAWMFEVSEVIHYYEAWLAFLAIVIIKAVGREATQFFRYVSRLFHIAPNMFQDPKAFGAFVQLILIAVFTGWVISKLKRK